MSTGKNDGNCATGCGYCEPQAKPAELPLTGGHKYDGNKIPVDLISSEAILRVAEVLDFGAKKYEAHNWRKGIAYSRVVAAAIRHIMAWKDGEDNDPESGLNHLAHAGCCIMFLLEYLKTHPEMDDRWKGK